MGVQVRFAEFRLMTDEVIFGPFEGIPAASIVTVFTSLNSPHPFSL